MKSIRWLLLFLLPTYLAASVYKWVDSNGEVHFSEKPHSGSSEVRVHGVESTEKVTEKETPKATGEENKDAPIDKEKYASHPAYTKFKMITPTDEETIRDADGKVDVAFSIEPSLDKAHKIGIIVDGNHVKDTHDKMLVLSNFERGEHTIEAKIFDADDKVIASTDKVKIFMQPPRAKGN